MFGKKGNSSGLAVRRCTGLSKAGEEGLNREAGQGTLRSARRSREL